MNIVFAMDSKKKPTEPILIIISLAQSNYILLTTKILVQSVCSGHIVINGFLFDKINSLVF